MIIRSCFILLAALALPGIAQAAPASPEGIAFFEQKVRPVLVEHCYKCHSTGSTKIRGELLLDSRDGMLRGGASKAPLVVPGDPEKSLLIAAVRHTDPELEMPPKERLSDRQIADLVAWVKMGAPDPRTAASARPAKPALDPASHWAFAAPKLAAPPAVKNAAWAKTDLDRFILAKLEEKGLSPAAQADKRTLIRRATFDLIGLPPTPEEVDAFLADSSPDAFAKVIDRLLASPHYGERWGRHWLDVVRYGESQGFERNRIRDNAWRYRDWVIDAFNRDLPYDEFIRRQIAGDVLHPGEYDAIVATGFHVIGTWDMVGELEGSKVMQKQSREDQMEDFVATLGQAFLALTVNCARCHDHKFDPITQKEYYQFAALVGGVSQAEKERNVAAARDARREPALRKELEDATRELAALEAAIRGKADGDIKSAPVVEGLQALYVIDGKPTALTDGAGSGGVELRRGDKTPWASAEPAQKLVRAAKGAKELTIEAWFTPAKPGQAGPARIVSLSRDTGQRNFTIGHDGDKYQVRFRTTKTDANGLPALTSPAGTAKAERTHLVYTFDRAGKARLYLNGKRVAEQDVGGQLSNWDDASRLLLGNELTGDRPWDGQHHFLAIYTRALGEAEIAANHKSESRNVRPGPSMADLLAKASKADAARHAELTATRDRLQQALAQAAFSGPLHVPTFKQPAIAHVLERGVAAKPLDPVAPAALRAVRGPSPDFGLAQDAPEAARRVKLAEWLTDPRNPLVARVFVNRVWHYHFGQGIVTTPSEFGLNGDRPSHPELLDYLATRFVQGGWRIKDLHRAIMTSAAYQQQSQVHNAAAEKIDADNRLLWRFNRRRLEGEAIRDSILAVAGVLNPQIGGPSYRDVKISRINNNDTFTDATNEFTEKTLRRTVYRLWARAGNLPLLDALDCPDPTVMTPRRMTTTTPLQALSLMNNPLLERCAADFAARLKREAGTDTAAQVARAYRLALGRMPTDQEKTLAAAFVREFGMEQFCLVLYSTSEFLFLE